MTFEPIWGAIIAWYLFLAGLGGGAFVTSAFLGWRHPEAVSMRKIGHLVAPIVVIIGLCLLMFDAKAGLMNPLRFALLLTNFGSVMTWGVVFLGGFTVISLVVVVLDFMKKRVPVWLDIAGVVFGVRGRLHGRAPGRVQDVPAVEQRAAAHPVPRVGHVHRCGVGAAHRHLQAR